MPVDESLASLPFYNLTTAELIGDLLYTSITVKESYCQNPSFYNDICSASNNSILQELQFRYSTDDEFNDLVKKTASSLELSIFHINIRSLNKNHRRLIYFLQSLDITFDVIVLSEIWNYNLDFYHNIFSDYCFYYTTPVSSKVGGVGIYVKNSFSCTQLHDLHIESNPDNMVETLWLEICKDKNKYIVAGIYRHPNHKIADFTSSLEQCLASVNKMNTPCIIAGDINIDLTHYKKHAATDNYINNLLLYNFVPTIVMPTRITEKSATIVDHIYYFDGKNAKRNICTKSGNLWSDITDHLPSYLLISNTNKVTQHNPKMTRLFSDNNLQTFKTAINNTDWSQLYSYNDVNSAYQYFEDIITKCYNDSFPLIRISRRRAKDKKWITAGLKASSKRKNLLYRRWLQTKSPSDEAKYKKYRKVYKKLAFEAEQSYYRNLFDSKTNSIKKLWSNLNTMCSFNNKKSKQTITKLCANNQTFTDPMQISDCLNEYFCTIGNNLAHSLPNTDTQSFKKFLPKSNKGSMFCNPTTCLEVFKIIQALKNNKSPGPDNFGPKIVKLIADVIASPLSFIYNLSFTNGIVPDRLKISKVIPVYKKGDKNLMENYRPISLLNVFEKILEKLMYKRLYEYISAESPLYKFQFGFRKYHSTALALIAVTDEIYQQLDNGNIVMGIYCDLQKAFDTVNHSILLSKIYNYGIRGTVFNWFKNYLTNRKQYVAIDNVSSTISNIDCGVPQGSVLGPLLFLIYMNDIQYCSRDCNLYLFADDTNVFVSGKTVPDVTNKANNCMCDLNSWFLCNRLSLNLDKTYFSVFGAGKADINFELTIDGTVIKQVNTCKYLGIMIDDKLSWQDHIDFVYNKVVRFVSIFYRIRHRLSCELSKMMYFAFVYSHLCYGIEIYGNTYHSYLNKLIILNNKILRILQNESYRTPVAEFYENYNTLSIPKLHNYRILSLVHKFTYHNSKLPIVFSTYFNDNQLFYEYNTRGKKLLHLTGCHTSVGHKCIKYKGCKLWNNLPLDLKSITCNKSFNNKLKIFLRSSSD